MKSVSLFIPVYNEEDIIKENIENVYNQIKKLTTKFEIFIIDDGSNDNTNNIIKELVNDKIKYIRYNNGPSRRENLAKSFSKANNEIIVFMDADLSTDLESLKELINSIDEADIGTGSRYVKGAEIERNLYRRVISFFYNKFIQIYFNSKIKDHQCGFKTFKKKIILDLVNEMGYDYNFKRGFFWDAEVLIRAQKKGYKIKEIPVKWTKGQRSSFRIKREIKMIPYVLKLKKKLTG